MVTLFNLNGNNPLESAVPPKNIGVFLDQSIPPPVAVSTPDSINLTAIFTFEIGLSSSLELT